MHFSRPTKFFWTFLLSALLSNVPYVAWAESLQPQQMIPTSVLIEDMNRQEAKEKVEHFLSREDVQKELLKHGVSKAEAETRLAGLSDHELNQLAQQMDEARAGGDVGGILILVVLVLLIIFLAKRI